MATTSQLFPTWSTAPLNLPSDAALEYKFIVQREDLKGPATWEAFPGNRSVQTAGGHIITSRSEWNDSKSTNTSEPLPEAAAPEDAAEVRERSKSGEEIEAARHEQDDLLLKLAESHVEQAHEETVAECPLAVTIEKRDFMRRNFSQSLLGLDFLGPDPERQVSPLKPEDELVHADAEPDVTVSQTPLEDEAEAAEEEDIVKLEDVQATRGVPLQHISSFSALTELMEPDQKEEVRQGKQKAQSHYEPYNLNVPVVIVSSEVAPFSKTGGLGLVAASYSYEFARNGHRTMAISPKYKHYDGINFVGETRVRVNGQEECVKYWHKYVEVAEGRGCDYIFVEGAGIQRDGGLYNDNDGREYPDNLFRFALLSFAAMEAPLILRINGSTYGDKVLFLANDWQSGLVPLLLCYKYRKNNCYQQSRCIYVVHNLGYQGQYHNCDAQHMFGLDHQASQDVSLGNAVNLTKGALVCADRVLTVSPNYAQEIQTPAGGFNLQDFVRAKAQALRLSGILNGIDDCWNPEIDADIAFNYSVDNFEKGKRENKAALQKMLGLEVRDDVALLGFVGRLTWQKGVDVLAQAIDWLMKDENNGVTGKVQLIMMGNGERSHAETLRHAEGQYKQKVCGYVGFDPKVEHQMMAGCDIFVMPSRYEPCGLPQMYSQAYGTLPIVTATGGLVDSVKDVAEGTDVATGFHMTHCAADKMKECLWKALEIFHKRRSDFINMQRTAMMMDFYWPQAMDEYEKNIDYTLYDPPLQR